LLVELLTFGHYILIPKNRSKKTVRTVTSHEEVKFGGIKRRRRMIPKIKKILYTTDLTKNSSYAFYFAIDLARKHDVRMVVLHCIATISPSLYIDGGITEEISNVLQREKEQEKKEDVVKITKRLQGFCQRVESEIGSPCVDLISKIIVKESYPVDEILNTADREECDIIVLGTHGKGWLKHTFLGSVAASVLERTRKPVFIIPLPSEQQTI
jgi:nucleotide-binding universal stress UspA family protein